MFLLKMLCISFHMIDEMINFHNISFPYNIRIEMPYRDVEGRKNYEEHEFKEEHIKNWFMKTLCRFVFAFHPRVIALDIHFGCITELKSHRQEGVCQTYFWKILKFAMLWSLIKWNGLTTMILNINEDNFRRPTSLILCRWYSLFKFQASIVFIPTFRMFTVETMININAFECRTYASDNLFIQRC